MNIFVLDYNPQKAAEYHCDVHVVKMLMETAQIMSTVAMGPLAPTHENHPCVRWASESSANFMWLKQLGMSLCEEYTYRYCKVHKYEPIIFSLAVSHNIATSKTPFALAMPDEYKQNSAVQSYRAYYQHEKTKMSRFGYNKTRAKPFWLRI